MTEPSAPYHIAPATAPVRRRVTVVVTDVDNTLYDWVAMWSSRR